MDQHHARWRAGLRVPDPLFATTIPAGRQSSRPAPRPPDGRPDPRYSSRGIGVGPLRWAGCPNEGHPHLLPRAQVPLP